MMRTRASGVTLLELLVSLCLLAALAVFVGSITSSFHTMKRDLIEKERGKSQGQVTTTFIFERVLRAQLLNTKDAFAIEDNGRKVVFKRPGASEEIYLDTQAKCVRYTDGKVDKVVLSGVKDIVFFEAADEGSPWNRLDVDIVMEEGEPFRISVQPRISPKSNIN
jgi:hypothetical protein